MLPLSTKDAKMKNLLFIFSLIMAQVLHAQEVTTSYFLIRHAEKADSSKDTSLSEKGLERAAKWDRALQNISFDAVYCTIYKRTQQTAQPAANRNHKNIIIYNHKELDIPKFKKETLGKNVLIVGHSNSIPGLVNTLIGQPKYQEIDESVFGNLYLVVVKGDSVTDYLFQF